MRILIWLIRLAVFVLLLGFAARNDDLVTVSFFLGAQWQLPLVVVMLLMFAAGALAGGLALLPALLAKRREISRLSSLRGETGVQRNVRPQYPDSL